MKTEASTEIGRLRADVKGLRVLLARACSWDRDLERDVPEAERVVPAWREDAEELLKVVDCA
jgi:hypothetical protein